MKKISFLILFPLCFVCLQAKEKRLKDAFLTDKEFNKNLSKWLHFHELSIEDFQLDGTNTILLEEDTTSIYYRKFDEYQLHSDSVLEHYSPNKKRYVSLLPTKGVFCDGDTKQYSYIGGDDCEEIYYIDLDTQRTQMIQWNGSSRQAEEVIWLNDYIFALVAIDFSENMIYSIEIYTILNDKNQAKINRYKANTNRYESKSYFHEVVLKERNIKVDY